MKNFKSAGKFLGTKTGILFFAGDKILLLDGKKENRKLTIPEVIIKEGDKFQDVLEKNVGGILKGKKEIILERIKIEKTFIDFSEEKKRGGYLLISICEAIISKPFATKKNEQWVIPQEALKLDLDPFAAKVIQKYLSYSQQEEYLAGWQRCKADFENYQKKVADLLDHARREVTDNFILEIIPVLNNFDLALAHVPEPALKEAWVEGIFYIQKQLADILKKEGVSEIEALGKKFDPAFHECLEKVKTDKEKNSGKIIEVIEKGYCRGEKVIKAAKVKVAA
jgi:molecular chaperone GrpE